MPRATKRPRKRRPAPERRALIVDAARRVIAERGFAFTTMRDIAAASDVSLGTLSYHFDGISEILREALLQERQAFSKRVDGDGRELSSGLEDVRAWVTRQLRPTPASRQHWLLWVDFWTLAAHDEDAAAFQAEFYAETTDNLRALLQRGRDDGSLTFNDLAATVTEMMALMDGLAAHAFLPADRVKEHQAMTITLQYVDRLATGG